MPVHHGRHGQRHCTSAARTRAAEVGILTVGVVTKPFEFEGGRRMTNADAGLTELEANVDSIVAQ
jgi:cell division GTPase FtsZ